MRNSACRMATDAGLRGLCPLVPGREMISLHPRIWVPSLKQPLECVANYRRGKGSAREFCGQHVLCEPSKSAQQPRPTAHPKTSSTRQVDIHRAGQSFPPRQVRLRPTERPVKSLCCSYAEPCGFPAPSAGESPCEPPSDCCHKYCGDRDPDSAPSSVAAFEAFLQALQYYALDREYLQPGHYGRTAS